MASFSSTRRPTRVGGNSVGNSVPREMHCVVVALADGCRPASPADPAVQKTRSSGNGLMRPLEVAARKRRRRDPARAPHDRDLSRSAERGPRARHRGRPQAATRLNIRARKAVIIGTGGSTGNVNFRRMFDPRLTEEYCGLAGMPWSDQDASGELAAMAIGASLWGLLQPDRRIRLPTSPSPEFIGCQYNYLNLQLDARQPGFRQGTRDAACACRIGRTSSCVNMLGRRFYDETGGQYTANNYNSIEPYVQGS